MSDSAYVCGTGGWGGPKPGDPDNNVLLSAVPAFGGIDVSWTYPSTNPYAVAHTLLYRSTSNSFNTAVQISIVSGNFFYDKSSISVPITYFYWIQVVSVNGTVGATVGPASAMARPTIETTIQQLTGKIDAGLLATSLRADITNINTVGANLNKEIQDRIAANTILSGAINETNNATNRAVSYITQEITNRTNADTALVNQLSIMAVKVNQNTAAILKEETVRVAADEAVAEQLEFLTAAVDENSAAILEEKEVRADANEALAEQFTTLNSTVNGNTATGQVGLSTKVTTLDGKVTSIGALYTAKVNVNGLIGGFGVYNDGKTVEAGFDVDRFWIGRTGVNKRKPFIIENDTVYIDDAAINKLTISKLRSEDNSLAFQNGKLRADLLEVKQVTGGAFSSYNWPAAGLNGFYLGPGGLLLGNNNTLPGQPQKFLQLTSEGNFYAPGMSIVNGNLTIDKIDVIDTLNIKGNAVTVPMTFTGAPNHFVNNTTPEYPANNRTGFVSSAVSLVAGSNVTLILTTRHNGSGAPTNLHAIAYLVNLNNFVPPQIIVDDSVSVQANLGETAIFSAQVPVTVTGTYRIDLYFYNSTGPGYGLLRFSCTAFGSQR